VRETLAAVGNGLPRDRTAADGSYFSQDPILSHTFSGVSGRSLIRLSGSVRATKRVIAAKGVSLVVALILLAVPKAGYPQVPGIINYQGRIVDNGTNFTGTGQFEFALINGTLGTTNYWANDATPIGQPGFAVPLPVNNGLYSVLLGNTTISNMAFAIPATVFTNTDVRLRVWFNDGVSGFQQLTPDQRIAAVGYALMAANVPEGAIGSAQLASNAVTAANLAPGAVTAAAIAPGAVTAAAIADGSVGSSELASNAINAANLVAPLAAQGVLTLGSITNNSQWQSMASGGDTYVMPTNSIYYGPGSGGGHMCLWVSPSPYTLFAFYIGNLPSEDTNQIHGARGGGGPFCDGGSDEVFLTNNTPGVSTLSPSGHLYLYSAQSNLYAAAYNQIFTLWSPDNAAISNDLTYIGQLVVTDAWVCASEPALSSPYDWVNTNGELYTFFNVFSTNNCGGVWHAGFVKRDSTFTNYTASGDISAAAFSSSGQDYSVDDLCVYTDRSGLTNWIMGEVDGRGLAVNYTTSFPPTNNFALTAPYIFGSSAVGGGGQLWQDANGIWYAQKWIASTLGYVTYNFSPNSPLGTATQVASAEPAQGWGGRFRRAVTAQEVADVTAGYLRSILINAPMAWYEVPLMAQTAMNGCSPTFNSLAVSNTVTISGAATISGNANIAQGGTATIAGLNFGSGYGSSFLPEITATSTVQEVALYTASNFGSSTYNTTYTNQNLTSTLMRYGVVGLWSGGGSMFGQFLMNNDWGNEWILANFSLSTNAVYWSTNGLAGQWYTAGGVATTGVVVAGGTYTNQSGFVAPDFGGGISLFGGQVLWTPGGNMVIGGVTNQIVFNNSSPNFRTVVDNTEIVSNLIVVSVASIPSNTAGFATNSCYGRISNYVVGSTVTNNCGQRALFWLSLSYPGGGSVSGTNALYLIPGNGVVTQLVELGQSVVNPATAISMKLGPIPLSPGDAIMSSNMVDSSGNGANNCSNVTGAWLIGW